MFRVTEVVWNEEQRSLLKLHQYCSACATSKQMGQLQQKQQYHPGRGGRGCCGGQWNCTTFKLYFCPVGSLAPTRLQHIGNASAFGSSQLSVSGLFQFAVCCDTPPPPMPRPPTACVCSGSDPNSLEFAGRLVQRTLLTIAAAGDALVATFGVGQRALGSLFAVWASREVGSRG